MPGESQSPLCKVLTGMEGPQTRVPLKSVWTSSQRSGGDGEGLELLGQVPSGESGFLLRPMGALSV